MPFFVAAQLMVSLLIVFCIHVGRAMLFMCRVGSCRGFELDGITCSCCAYASVFALFPFCPRYVCRCERARGWLAFHFCTRASSCYSIFVAKSQSVSRLLVLAILFLLMHSHLPLSVCSWGSCRLPLELRR